METIKYIITDQSTKYFFVDASHYGYGFNNKQIKSIKFTDQLSKACIFNTIKLAQSFLDIDKICEVEYLESSKFGLDLKALSIIPIKITYNL